MNNILKRKTIRTYTYYSESHPNEKVAVITLVESLFESTGHIEVINKDLAPVLLKLCEERSNNFASAMSCLEERAMPPNRMGFAEYCSEHGLNPYDINDRLKLSKGQTYIDDLYIVIEERIEDV